MDAMVTSRMPQGKKEAGNAVLSKLGVSPSRAINDFYDYLIREKKLPFSDDVRSSLDKDSIKEALAWVEDMSFPPGNEFSHMSDGEIKEDRLVSRGLLDGLSL